MQKRPLTALQLSQLSADLNALRIASRQGTGKAKLSYLEAWDVRAMFIRIFGYGGFSYTTKIDIVNWENDAKRNAGGTQFRITAMATVKLYIPQLDATYEEAAVSSQAQPDPGECADFAVKTAESDALKRCAVNLGTQFGLSLYNKGATSDVVKVTREPYQAAILARLAHGEKPSAIDADLQKSLEHAVDVAEPKDDDRSYGYDPDTGTQDDGQPAPGESPAEDAPPPPASPAAKQAATARVARGFARDS